MKIKLFAQLKDAAGKEEIDFRMGEPLAVDQVLALVARMEPGLAPFLRAVKVAVNMEISSGERQVRERDEIALLPPFSGG